MIKADLHVHSNCSDGSDSPKELIKKIQEAGINIFALTDHDTVDGGLEISDIIPTNIEYIPSIELTCKSENINCHILGYFCNLKNDVLNKLIIKGKQLRREKLEARIQYLKNIWNISLTPSELEWLYTRKSVVKTHLANILVKRGLANDNLSAMKKYLDNCKTGNTKFSIQEAIDAIYSAGGIPVWAHPLGGEGEIHYTKEEFLPILKKMLTFNIKGLECYYSRYSMQEINFLLDCAKQNNLLISGGSDYHGTNKDIPLGKLNTELLEISADKLTILSYTTR